MKAKRNKTIDFSLSESQDLLAKTVSSSSDESFVNKIVVGDMFEGIKKIPDKSVDLLIVDPPYNLNKAFHGNKFKKTDKEQYAKYTRAWIKEIKNKLKDTASIYVCSDWESSIAIAPILEEEFILRNRITWQREKGRGAKNNWKNSMEDIFFATVSDEYKFNLEYVKVRKRVLAPYKESGKPKDWEETKDGKFRNSCPSNFWDDITVPYWSMSENTAHPTQKPEKLIAKLILASSDENDFVLDPFGGSCTTGVVAKKLNRNFYIFEQNPLYCAWGQFRLEQADKNKAIQGYHDNVFWERNSKPNEK